MIVFDRELLRNTFLLEDAKALHEGKFITKEQYHHAKKEFPTLKTSSNWFFRIAFLVLGWFCYSSGSGVSTVIFMDALDVYWISFYIMAAIGIVAAELFTRNKFYAHGLDDAAILGFQGFLAAAVGASTEAVVPTLAVAIIVGILCTLRYLNTISAIIAVGATIGLICYMVVELHLIPELYLTFLLFVFAIGLYIFYRIFSKKKVSEFYKNPLQAVEVLSLLLAYFSVNYLVVREFAQDLMGILVTPTNDIPLAFAFYFFTFAVPAVYLFFGIKEKNKTMLWVGIFTVGFSIFTIRFYYHIMPPEWALLLGGIGLAVISLLLIRKLKHKERGVTFQKDRMHDSKALSVAQAVIVNSHGLGHGPAQGNMPFGGGGFSGGGAGETY